METRSVETRLIASLLWGCEVKFKFPVVKLLDYSQRWAELEDNSNPFATVVMAHLKAKETRLDDSRRKRWKLDLTKRLYEKGYQREEIINLFRFIDWVMRLPEELERSFWQEVTQYEEEKKMPYVTTGERIGLQKGLLEGIKMGLELKFGSEGLGIIPEIQEIRNVDILKAILTSIKTANTIEELRRVYQ